jgi:hypothetical protein
MWGSAFFHSAAVGTLLRANREAARIAFVISLDRDMP